MGGLLCFHMLVRCMFGSKIENKCIDVEIFAHLFLNIFKALCLCDIQFIILNKPHIRWWHVSHTLVRSEKKEEENRALCVYVCILRMNTDLLKMGCYVLFLLFCTYNFVIMSSITNLSSAIAFLIDTQICQKKCTMPISQHYYFHDTWNDLEIGKCRKPIGGRFICI